VQEQLGLIARIIARATDLAGDEGRAIIWFRQQPIAGWGKTAEELVGEGRADEVLAGLPMRRGTCAVGQLEGDGRAVQPHAAKLDAGASSDRGGRAMRFWWRCIDQLRCNATGSGHSLSPVRRRIRRKRRNNGCLNLGCFW